MKKVWIMMLMLLLCLNIMTPVFATDAMPRLVDQADLLTASEETELLQKLDSISAEQGMDVVIVTTDELNGKSPTAYADDFYDDNGYSNDGVLLLVSMEDRDWKISTSGYGVTAFTDAGIKYVGKQISDSLGDDNYAEAFGIYADTCQKFIKQARSGDPYDTHNLPKEPFDVKFTLLVSLGIGFLIALVIATIMKSQLKSVRKKAGASDYVKAGSMNVSRRQDLFLYREVQKREKPKSSSGSSTHTSSSGRTHGGGGGKF